MTDILTNTARIFGVTVAELTGPRRCRHISEARQAAAYAARKQTTMSLCEIARALGRSDHTTIISACQAAETHARVNYDYALLLAALL